MRTNKERMDAEAALKQESSEYWKAHIVPRIHACKTRADVQKVMDDVAQECVGNEKIRKMRAYFLPGFILARSSFPREVM